jgi:hypothetical protein
MGQVILRRVVIWAGHFPAKPQRPVGDVPGHYFPRGAPRRGTRSFSQGAGVVWKGEGRCGAQGGLCTHKPLNLMGGRCKSAQVGLAHAHLGGLGCLGVHWAIWAGHFPARVPEAPVGDSGSRGLGRGTRKRHKARRGSAGALLNISPPPGHYFPRGAHTPRRRTRSFYASSKGLDRFRRKDSIVFPRCAGSIILEGCARVFGETKWRTTVWRITVRQIRKACTRSG